MKKAIDIVFWVLILIVFGIFLFRGDPAETERRDLEFNYCMDWAFGSGWDRVEQRFLPDRWNKLHGDLFIIEGSDEISKTNDKIRKAYLEHFGLESMDGKGF